MAGKKGKTRIEPSFSAAPQRSPGLSLKLDDRIVPPKTRGKSAKRAPPAALQKPRRSLFRPLRRLLYWCVVLGIWGGIGLVGLVVWYGAQMPSVADWALPDRPPNVKIVSTDGQLVANRGASGGEAVPLSAMSPFIPQAVIAIEDRRFRSHWGIDPMGLGRALVQNLAGRRVAQGGSTLTQQLAKNLFLKPDRTLERKVQEMLLAVWLEHKYSKDQILEIYLNRVYFGSGAYGVEAASRRYFNKPARDVSLAEAAILAGLLKAPSKLSPARDPEAAQARAQLVLAAMREQNAITDRQMAGAISTPASHAPSYWTGSENYVADLVMDDLPDLIGGEARSDLVVETTVDMRLQKGAEGSIRRLIDEKGKELAVSQGALVSIDGTGAVRACVGGVDYAGSQFDRATEAKRQPGSAFKPFVYLAALEAGRATPGSVRVDAPVRFGKWAPENYKGKYYGPVTLTTALAKSLNSVAAQLAMEVGPDAVAQVAHRLGIRSPLRADLTIALGTSEVTPLELTSAYVPFANGGLKPDIHLISSVRTVRGEVLYRHPSPKLPRVLSPQVVGQMNGMMAQTILEGTARKAAFGWPAAGKTGTSQNARDAWFVGYTANLTTGVWFGNDNGAPMKDVTGGSLPALAWNEFMTAAHQGIPVAQLPGGWRSGPETPAVMPAAAERPLDEGAPVSDAGAFPPPPDQGATGSIDGPVPPRDIGGPKAKPGSLMDVLLGN